MNKYLDLIECVAIPGNDWEDLTPEMQERFIIDLNEIGKTPEEFSADIKKYHNGDLDIAIEEERKREEFRKKELAELIADYKEHYNDLTPGERLSCEQVIARAREEGII